MRIQPAILWSIIVPTGRNLLSVTLAWILSLAFVQVGLRELGGWPWAEIGQSLGLMFGVAISMRLKATLAAYFLSAMLAFSLSELAIHSWYGIRAAQGAPTHFAVMAAALMGVTIGALLMMRSRRATGLTPIS